MLKNMDIVRKISISAFTVLVIALGLIALLSKDDNGYLEEGIAILSDGWTITYTDEAGTVIQEEISLPFDTEYVSEEGIVLTRILPDETEDYYVFIEGYHQDMEAWIDGVLVEKYGGADHRLFGRTSPSVTMMVQVTEDDMGKELSIRYSSEFNKYRTNLRSVYMGTQTQFLHMMWDEYMVDVFYGILYIAIAVIWFLIYFVLYFLFKQHTDVYYLGYFGLLFGAWILFNSRIRQFYLTDIFFADKASYVLLAVLVIPCLQFLNGRQEHRYQKSCLTICAFMVLNALTSFSMDFFGITDMGISLVVTHILIFIAIGYVLLVLILDFKKGQWANLKEVMIGFVAITLSGLVRMICIFVFNVDKEVGSTIFYFGGLLMMLIMGSGNIRAWIENQRRTQNAIHANKAKSDFLANMSHEIRTPINAVIGMNEMILRETDSEYIKSYSIKIKNAGNLLLSIVNDILDFSKIEAGKMTLAENEYEMVPLLNDVVNMMKIRAEDKGLEFILKIDNNLPMKLYGDGVRICQIMTNILSNAVKYTRQGSVTFEVKMSPERKDVIVVTVTDTGIGIREEDMAVLFNSFQRLDERYNHNVEGTGLGMAITSHFLKLMNSELQVSSTYGKGSVFWFELPQVILDPTPIGDYEKAYKQYEKLKKAEHSGFIAPEAKILVVDDNEMNLEVLEGLLKETQIQITKADRGIRAVELVRSFRYDLVLLDHMMPGMDGIETLKKIREQEKRERENGNEVYETPVVVLTANAISGAREMYLKEGFLDYLVKPIVGAELERVLRKYIPAEYIQPLETQKKNEEKPAQQPVVQEAESSASDSVSAYNSAIEKYLQTYGINMEDGIRYSADKPGKYKLMLGAYSKFDAPRRVKLAEFIEKKDMEGYAIEVHALKGNAYGIGANNLAKIALQHEQKSKEKDFDFVQGNFDYLQEEMDLVMRGIKQILDDDILLDIAVMKDPSKKEKDAASKPTSKVAVRNIAGNRNTDKQQASESRLDSERRKQYLKEVIQSNSEYNHKEAIGKIDDWLKKEPNKELHKELMEISKMISEFDFEEAAGSLQTLSITVENMR